MRWGRALAGAAAALLVALAAIAQDALAVPKLVARVTDQTGTLSAEQRDALEARLRAFEEAKGSQVAVLLEPTLGGEAIEDFAGRVADTWQLGRKGVDDGVLFVVALQERRMRIHTGRGVQVTLTDALSKRIVAEIVAPHFRAGDFPGGIAAGVEAILKAVEGEGLAAPPRKPSSGSAGGISDYGNFLVVGFFLVPVLAMVLRGIFGRLLGAGVTSGLTGAAAWIVFGSIAFGVVAAVLALVITLFSGSGFARSAGRGGWGGGYIPSGGGGWGGGGGGGFSGGGGGFDGGGASGSW